MELRNDVPQPCKIRLRQPPVRLDDGGHAGATLDHGAALRFREVQNIMKIGFGNHDEPGNQRVAMQQDVTISRLPQTVTVGQQLRMDLERHEFLSIRSGF